MQTKPRLFVIDNYNDLKITKAALVRNVADIQNGMRFDHFEEGHDAYTKKIFDSLNIVNQRLENLEK